MTPEEMGWLIAEMWVKALIFDMAPDPPPLTLTVRLCDECACGIVNDDWTHLDYDGVEEGDEVMASIQGTLEILGWLTLVGPSADGGCFDCAICSDIQYGGGSLFSGVSS